MELQAWNTQPILGSAYFFFLQIKSYIWVYIAVNFTLLPNCRQPSFKLPAITTQQITILAWIFSSDLKSWKSSASIFWKSPIFCELPGLSLAVPYFLSLCGLPSPFSDPDAVTVLQGLFRALSAPVLSVSVRKITGEKHEGLSMYQ